MAVLVGDVAFSVDLSWVVDAVFTVVLTLVAANVYGVVDASVIVAVVIANVNGVVDASVVVIVVIPVVGGRDVVSVFETISP